MFPAWHTKAAPSGKCCEGYIVPSMVRLIYQFQACWNKGRLCWKIAKLFYFCHLKKLVRPETFGPYHVRQHSKFAEKKMLRRPPIGRTCWSENGGKADWAARMLYEILLFLCEWDSRARDGHCCVKQWQLRGETIINQKNKAHRDLVDKTKKYLP